MNFNTDVLSVIKSSYHQTSTSVQVNGHLSGDIELQRGVRQGRPLSPSLYVYCICMCMLNHFCLILGIRAVL